MFIELKENNWLLPSCLFLEAGVQGLINAETHSENLDVQREWLKEGMQKKCPTCNIILCLGFYHDLFI